MHAILLLAGLPSARADFPRFSMSSLQGKLKKECVRAPAGLAFLESNEN